MKKFLCLLVVVGGTLFSEALTASAQLSLNFSSSPGRATFDYPNNSQLSFYNQMAASGVLEVGLSAKPSPLWTATNFTTNRIALTNYDRAWAHATIYSTNINFTTQTKRQFDSPLISPK